MGGVLKKMIKHFFVFSSLILLFSGCSEYKNISDASGFDIISKRVMGSNDFQGLIDNLVKQSEGKLKRYLMKDDVVLVSDFVNLDRLENRSKLGFLLSDHLKNSLLKRDIIVRQVELGKQFQIGKHGFSLLTRNQRDISSTDVDNKYAIVGTYSITTENLVVFIKLIDITNGNILSSANARTSVDDEIIDLENGDGKNSIIAPMVL
jgi:TolB-like protein